MDAGLAAVLGALAGAGATIGAALASGRSSRMQAEIAARAEHRRQRREPREAVYKGFIAAVLAMRDHLYPLSEFVLIADSEFTFDFAGLAAVLADDVKARWLEVALAGPKTVEEPAARLERASRQTAQTSSRLASSEEEPELARPVMEAVFGERVDEVMRQRTEGRARVHKEFLEASRAISVDLEAFIAAAQVALDDDGIRAR